MAISTNLKNHGPIDEDQAIEYNADHLLQLIPTFEEYVIGSLQEYDEKAFNFFATECTQNVGKAITEMDTQHIEFSGQLQKGNKEGKGGHKCKETGNFYYGSW